MSASIGYATLQVIPSAKGFSGLLANEAAPEADTAGKAIGSKMGGGILASIKSFAAPLAAVFAADKIINFGKDAIEQASGLNEAANAIQVSFGGAAAGVMNLGKQAATSLGLSNLQFDNLAVQFSAFSKTIAGPGGDVVGTLDSITKRASDFASVMNLDVSDSAALFQSALAGESEPLRRYGIDVSAATVASYAYANGIAAQGAQLTEQQRVQATYGSLMAQTSQVQGDFAKTSDQLANSQRINAAVMDDLKAKIGAGFLPIMREVSTLIGSAVLPALDWLVTNAPAAFAWVRDNAVPLGILGASLAAFTVIQNAAAISTGLVSAATQVWAGVQTVMNAVLTANPIGLVVLALGALVAGVVLAWQHSETFREVVTGAWDGIRAAASAVADWFTVTIPALWANITGWTSSAWNSIVDFFAAIPGRVVAFFLNWTLPGLLISHWGAITGAAQGAWNALVSWVGGIPDRFISALSAIGSTVAGAVSGWVGAVKDGAVARFMTLVDWVRGLPGMVLSALGDMGSTLLSAGGDLIGGFIRGIENAAGRLIAAVRSAITDRLPAFVKDALGIHSPSRVFMALGEYTAQGMALGIASGAGDVQRAADALVPSGAFASPKVGTSVVGALAAAATSAPVYVQNPWGPEYMRAETAKVAGQIQEGRLTPLDYGTTSW